MNLVEIIILAVVLGIDCMVVSFSQGLVIKDKKFYIIQALIMGIFQGIMPVIGYFGINSVSKYVEPYSNWLVFCIFMILGLKFIFEAFNEKKEINCIDYNCIITMGIATSIDALAAGINLNLTHTPIVFSSLIIGIMSFLMSIGGFRLGVMFKLLPSKFLEISGGLILVFLAVKNLNF